MSKVFQSVVMILTIGILLTALNAGGVAGCGGGSSDSSDSGTSSDATKAATSTTLGASDESSDSGASGAAGLVVQALRVNQSAALKAATVTIPETTEAVSFPCGSGSATGSVTVSGSVTTDDVTGELTNLTIDLSQEFTFSGCTPEDIASTTDVDESDYTFDGTITGDGSLSGSGDSISFNFGADGSMTVSGACSGTLDFGMTVSGSGTLDSLDCTGSGSVQGTVCGETVDCTVSGDCENPTISGTGCE